MKKIINGYTFEHLGSTELWYLDELDVTLFASKTIFIEFNSIRDNDSSSISIILTDEQYEVINVDEIITALKIFLEQYSLCFNIKAIKEELQGIAKDREKDRDFSENFKLDEFNDFVISQVNNPYDKKIMSVILDFGNSIQVKFFIDSKRYEFNHHRYQKFEVKFNDKDAYTNKLIKKLTDYFNFGG